MYKIAIFLIRNAYIEIFILNIKFTGIIFNILLSKQVTAQISVATIAYNKYDNTFF